MKRILPFWRPVTDSSSSFFPVFLILPLFFLGQPPANAQASLQITEIFNGQNGPDLTADWFEVTNTGDAAWTTGVDADLYYDDESASAADADLIQGITDIQPGEYVIVLVTGDEVADRIAFNTVWSPVIDLTGVEVGWTDGAGLGSGGDAVNIWLGDPTASDPVDTEAYPNAEDFDGQSYDVELQAFSTVGNASGAVQTIALGGNSTDVPNIASPGNLGPIVVDPDAPAIVAFIDDLTPYLNITEEGPSIVGADINDPTDPASTIGIPFLLSDANSPLSDLVVTAASDNQAVVDDANLILEGTGGLRTLRIQPQGVGYANITITVTDLEEKSDSYTINYAASNAAVNETTSRFHYGASDGSTAQAIDENYMWVADDENQILRLYDRNQSGMPVKRINFVPDLGSDDEIDLEGSFRNGDLLYWMGSHTNDERSVIFGAIESDDGAEASLTYAGSYTSLRDDLVAWDSNNQHGLGVNYFGLATSFEIEGLAYDPNSPDGALLGFRGPLVDGKAILVPVTNFQSLVTTDAAAGSAVFGDPIEIGLDGHSFRSIECNDNGCLIVAGPAGTVTGFRLFTWSGNAEDAPEYRGLDLSGLANMSNFEGIVALPAGPFLGSDGDTATIQLLIDTGTFDYYGDGNEAKDLPFDEWKKFRTERITLGPVETPPAANPGDLVITEVLQNPAAVSDGNGEWFEIYNTTGQPIDLNNWVIADAGTDFHRIANEEPLIIDPGTYFVFGANADQATNGGYFADYEYGSAISLANGADELILIAPDGIVVDSLGWDGGPNFPDPEGASMSLQSPNLNNDEGANWCMAMTPYGDGDLGTPGAANDCPRSATADLQITEIWMGQDGTDLTADWFEITNFGDAAWVSGVSEALYYEDESQDPSEAELIAGITDIQPGESVIVVIGQEAEVSTFSIIWEPVYDLTDVGIGWADGAGLGQGGDAVTLFLGEPSSNNIIDYETYPAAPSGISYDVVLAAFSQVGTGQMQTGTNIAVATFATGGSDGLEPAIGSPGNKGPLVVPEAELVITEIFSGQSGDDLTADWFEIRNDGAAPWIAGTDPDLYYDDESAEPVDAALIEGISRIEPGASAIVIVDGNETDVATFVEVWSPVIDLTGVEIGYAFDAAGLGGGGDAVTLWLGDPNTTSPVDTASYPDTDGFDGQSYDVELMAFSVVGNANGAVQTIALGGDDMDVPNIGSPGNKGPVVSVVNRAAEYGLNIYPNPSRGPITVQITERLLIETAQVFDMNGRLMMSRNINAFGNFELDLTALPASIYMLRLQGEAGMATKRIVVSE